MFAKNIRLSDFADLKSSGYSGVAELLLEKLLKINYFRIFEDHLDFDNFT